MIGKYLDSVNFSLNWHSSPEVKKISTVINELFEERTEELFDKNEIQDPPDIFPFYNYPSNTKIKKYASDKHNYICYLHEDSCLISTPLGLDHKWEILFGLIEDVAETLAEILPVDDEEFHYHLHLEYQNKFEANDFDGKKDLEFLKDHTNLDFSCEIKGFETPVFKNTILTWEKGFGQFNILIQGNEEDTRLNIVSLSKIVSPNLEEIRNWSTAAHGCTREFFDDFLKK